MTPAQHTRLLGRLRRDHARCLAAEVRATDLAQAWRLAARSDRALRLVRLVEAGQPLPQAPRTARNLARGAFAALATVGRSIARALQCEAALARARAVLASRRRAALRRALSAVAVAALAVAVPAPLAAVLLVVLVALAGAPVPSSRATGPPRAGPMSDPARIVSL